MSARARGGFVQVVAVVAIVLAASGADAQEERPPDLYLRDCSFCHGRAGEGTEQGPPLAGVGGASADFYLRTGRMPIEPGAESATAAEPVYDEDQIRVLVDYVASLGPGPEVPDVEIDPELVPEGAELYQDNCAACHGTAGAGAALTSGVVAPDLYASSALETVEAIRIGPGTMPVFGPETLDDEQVDAIAAYVRYLDDPADRGGAPLGRIGPVTEGMVGWLIGLGSLVIAIRLIGTKVKR